MERRQKSFGSTLSRTNISEIRSLATCDPNSARLAKSYSRDADNLINRFPSSFLPLVSETAMERHSQVRSGSSIPKCWVPPLPWPLARLPVLIYISSLTHTHTYSHTQVRRLLGYHSCMRPWRMQLPLYSTDSQAPVHRRHHRTGSDEQSYAWGWGDAYCKPQNLAARSGQILRSARASLDSKHEILRGDLPPSPRDASAEEEKRHNGYMARARLPSPSKAARCRLVI
ncbi:hypothetical protein GGS23DRAFT_225972 [Durotheca rogersii]|uniref:uncharacterized protein n=1 Tax=Durotheca rogersii TaxID=419775 RepID=UPI00221F8254|nr:uncharacterized protein GGS23DRAFT_225972 [Durotheca rogersii]KAI5860494.1 hypothetical protein GGS23DRAFT_225972 [Durotheca rogersii]